MAKLSIIIGLFLSSLLAPAQGIEQTRLLAGNYLPQPLEQALITLTATNLVSAKTPVEYKAGQSVVLRAGFETKAGAIFTAHTGVVSSPTLAESELNSLTVRAHPNPFEEVTTITYVLTQSARTSLQIRDTEGRLINRLVDGLYQEAGRHSVEWKGAGIPAGTYMCILDTGPQRITKRIIRK